MSGYQRFVAYVYEYRKGKKDGSSGYVRVEVRDRKCLMEVHLRCAGLEPGNRCQVYGFVRREGLMDGIRIGECVTGRERIECMFETDSEDLGGMGKKLEDLGGMLLISEAGGFWGTEWDDQPIRPENFREWKKENVSEISEKAEEKKESSEMRLSEKIMTAEEYRGNETAGAAEEQKKNPENSEEPEDPFQDGQFTDCRRIKISDCSCLCRKNGCLCNNRFVIYGYESFGHLLLCKDHRGQYILGVPGGYSQQERFMANMFGFPYFKESPEICVPGGKGGYWYCVLNR